MVNLGGVYLRQFATGLVLVNPSTTTNQLSLGQPYRELDGTVVYTKGMQHPAKN